jgi:hypothetical protein
MPALKPVGSTTAGPASRRGRRSAANLNEESRRAKEMQKEITITRAEAPPPLPARAVDNEVTQQIAVPPDHEPTKKRPRASKPAAQETKKGGPPPLMNPPPTELAPEGPAPTTEFASAGPTTEEMDQWPTQSLTGEEDSPTDERTRIGTPAYADEAKMAVAPAVDRVTSTTSNDQHPSQAVRVVVWRASDGVHVAPQGTTVSAISVEAMLVALDPSADLAAWLKQS